MKIVVVSSAALPTPAPVPMLPFSIRRTFGKAICKICRKEFLKLSSVAVCCSKPCRQKNKRNLMHNWRGNNVEYVQNYMKQRAFTDDIIRRNRRQDVRNMWGLHQDWRLSEKIAVKILEEMEGYHDVSHLEYLPTCPFDIIAFKNGQGFLFQVGTRTHMKKNRQNRLANDLKMKHMAIFVSIVMKKYFIKPLSKGGNAELGLKEVKEARKYA